jgi:DNA-binding LacI/PurR family transcriptional regulator
MRAFKKSTINDVARHAGVSTTTISYFVNGRTSVCSPETALRIRDAIDKLHYTPNSLTKGLRQKRTNTIGVCVLNPLEPGLQYGASYFEQLWRGILHQADAERFSLLHYPSAVRDNRDEWDVFLDGRVDGVLFHSGHDLHVRRVAEAGMPIVVIDSARNLPEGAGSAYSDARGTANLALAHLWDLGHRRIAHIAGPLDAGRGENPGDLAVRRYEAYLEWTRSRSVLDLDLVGWAGSWERISDSGFIDRWNSLLDPPTAVFCANDALAIAFIDHIKRSGSDVRGRYSIVGIDNLESARVSDPPLTSVQVPVEEIGRQAVRSLLGVLRGCPLDQCRVAVPVTEIVMRQSTRAI